MPVMDGFEATRRLRARGCGLPIIALTAGVLTEERAACIAAGMDAFLSKPVKLRDLLTTIEESINRREGIAVAGSLVVAGGGDEQPVIMAGEEGMGEESVADDER